MSLVGYGGTTILFLYRIRRHGHHELITAGRCHRALGERMPSKTHLLVDRDIESTK
jgi:hypothetical protein